MRLQPQADPDTRPAELRTQGRIRARRDEPSTLWQPRTRAPLAVIERATARYWGALTLGAHANGCVAEAAARATLDFALRHRLLDTATHARLEAEAAALWLPAAAPTSYRAG